MIHRLDVRSVDARRLLSPAELDRARRLAREVGPLDIDAALPALRLLDEAARRSWPTTPAVVPCAIDDSADRPRAPHQGAPR